MRAACRAALLGPLTDDPDLLAAMHDLVSATMPYDARAHDMSEPEELILEGAHFATRVARDVWRRYGTSVPDTTVPLASVRSGSKCS